MYPAVAASTSHQHLTTEASLIGRDSLPSNPPNPALIDDTQLALVPPVKKSHARKQPEGHIPRPRNAFILFRCDFVAQKKIPASVEPDHRNISRIVGRIWKAMSDEARRPWIEEAKRERERHKRLYPQYRYAPSSAASTAVGTALKEKRAQSQKIRESMGVLPVWGVVSPTKNSVTSPHQSTQEPQEREVLQVEMGSQPGAAASNDSWGTSISQDSGDSVASHAPSRSPSFVHSNSWESPCHFQQHWSLAGTPEPQHCSPHADTVTPECFKGISTPSPSQEVGPFDVPAPAASFHFDSPDPSPAESTRILPPFTFVAHHPAMTNTDLSAFHFAPAPGEVSAATLSFADLGVAVGDSKSQYQQHPYDSKTNPENVFESHAWTTDQIDDIIKSMQNGSSFDYASQ